MGRTSRVPYHQNVYDLLGIEPSVCPDAARMIAEHEAAHGPLPASVREWYLVPKVVPFDGYGRRAEGTLWREYSNRDDPAPLREVLAGFAQVAGAKAPVCVLYENQDIVAWWIEAAGADDPPVWDDVNRSVHRDDWRLVATAFSGFLTDWFVRMHLWQVGWEIYQHRPHSNGLWLRSPAEPFAPPVIDFLTEQFGEPERTAREGEVTTYTWRPDGGTIRVTADHPAHPEPLSAWWVHATAPEQLAAFARILKPWGTLSQTLRADTEPARAVWARPPGE